MLASAAIYTKRGFGQDMVFTMHLDPESERRLTTLTNDYVETRRILYRELSHALTPRSLLRATPAEIMALQESLDAFTRSPFDDKLVTRTQRGGLKLAGAGSFRNEMTRSFEAAKLGSPSATYFLNEKLAGYAFADALGVPRPKVFQVNKPFEEVLVKCPQVIKPSDSAGGSGVYLCFSDGHIRHAQNGDIFYTWNEFSEHAKKLLLRRLQRRRSVNSWFSEELLVEPDDSAVAAHDFKVYCCYGAPQLGLEIWRHPHKSYRFYTPDGKAVPMSEIAPGLVGTVKESNAHHAPLEHFRAAAEISNNLPAPFVSVDFLVTSRHRYLGEFTPKPGIFGQYSSNWDRQLGEETLRAEHRLTKDLLNGKEFDSFKKFHRDFNPSAILA